MGQERPTRPPPACKPCPHLTARPPDKQLQLDRELPATPPIAPATGGYLANVSDSVVAFVCPECGHHADLMFTNPADPESLTQVRAAERATLERWLAEYEGCSLSPC